MIPRRAFLTLFTILLLLSGSLNVSAQAGGAQVGDSETFPNGHVVSGEFLKFYHSVDDPDRIFGQPISVEFDNPLQPGSGIRIQYFQRVRMDYDPSKPAGQRVSLANLGKFALDDAKQGQPVPISTNNAMCRPFPNDISVCYAFMQLYNRYGEKYFGQPITNAMFGEDGRLVQYFENVRMEWRAELPNGQRAVLSELGQGDFDKHIGNSQLLKPSDSRLPAKIQPSLYAFTAHPLLAGGAQSQQVFALIYDQYSKPIQGVSITVNVIYPAGGPEPQSFSAQPTNELGYTEVNFDVKNVQPNQVVQVTIEADIANGLKTTASTWFRVWW